MDTDTAKTVAEAAAKLLIWLLSDTEKSCYLIGGLS